MALSYDARKMREKNVKLRDDVNFGKWRDELQELSCCSYVSIIFVLTFFLS